MKEIKLTRGMVAIVDDEDYPLLSQFTWSAHVQGNLTYAMRHIGGGEYVAMHRMIAGKDGLGVDHRDSNGLNNQRSNLRPSNQSQNSANQRKLVVGSSRFKGVHFYTRYQNWMAYICPRGTKIHLGYYSSEEAAAYAYNIAAVREYGQFARLNQVFAI